MVKSEVRPTDWDPMSPPPLLNDLLLAFFVIEALVTFFLFGEAFWGY